MTCPGTGGFVYTYEGPQFGAHIIEEPCDACGGFHEPNAPAPTPCPVCGGAGIVDTSPPGVEHTAPWLLTDTDCGACGGTGEIDPTTYEPDIEES